ncbi:hypothetical protein Tco_0469491 [Tanacetum coccineum]
MLALIHIKICSACRLGLVKLYDNLHELPKAINTLTVASLATSEKVKLQGFMFHFSPKLQVLHSLPESILHPYLLDCVFDVDELLFGDKGMFGLTDYVSSGGEVPKFGNVGGIVEGKDVAPVKMVKKVKKVKKSNKGVQVKNMILRSSVNAQNPSGEGRGGRSSASVEEEEQQLAHDEEIFREFMEEEARKEEEYARRCREEEEWEAQMDWTRPMHWTEDGNEGNKEG